MPPPVVHAVTTCFWIAAILGALTAVVLLVSGSVPGAVWYTDAPVHGPGLAIALLVGQAVVVGTAAATLVVSYYARGLPLNARRALRPMMFPTIGWCASITASAIWTGVESVSSPLRREVASDSSTTSSCSRPSSSGRWRPASGGLT